MNAEKKNFYGWILLVAIGIMFLCSSGFILVGASVVNPLMMADSSMNMNATLMGLGFTLFVLCQGIPAPLIGQFITKYGQKKTFIVGGLLLIIGGLLMAFVVKTTIGYLIAFGVILSIGSQMAGQVTMQTSVSAWFVQKRALAMSIATVIGAIGSFISPRIYQESACMLMHLDGLRSLHLPALLGSKRRRIYALPALGIRRKSFGLSRRRLPGYHRYIQQGIHKARR